MPSRGTRNYCFTWNNYPDDHVQQLGLVKPLYYKFGYEIAPNTGTPHLQGFLVFKDAKTITSLSKKLKGVHFEEMNGSLEANDNYCSKGADTIEFGVRPAQGKRTDLALVRDIIHQPNITMRRITEQVCSYQAIKHAEVLFKYHEKPRDWKPLVKWYYGESGAGKTRAAHQELSGAYVAMATAKWWEGYDGHSDVIIDDMRGDFCKFHELLRILDRYAYRIEVKGGSRQFVARNIIITSCFSPETLFQRCEEDIKQLLRRIDEIKIFSKDIDADKVSSPEITSS